MIWGGKAERATGCRRRGTHPRDRLACADSPEEGRCTWACTRSTSPGLRRHGRGEGREQLGGVDRSDLHVQALYDPAAALRQFAATADTTVRKAATRGPTPTTGCTICRRWVNRSRGDGRLSAVRGLSRPVATDLRRVQSEGRAADGPLQRWPNRGPTARLRRPDRRAAPVEVRARDRGASFERYVSEIAVSHRFLIVRIPQYRRLAPCRSRVT